MPDLKLVSIEWIDSKGATDRWEFRDDFAPLEPSRCTTVCFILEVPPTYKTVAHTISAEQVLGGITIPVRAILKEKNCTSTRPCCGFPSIGLER